MLNQGSGDGALEPAAGVHKTRHERGRPTVLLERIGNVRHVHVTFRTRKNFGKIGKVSHVHVTFRTGTN